jgi:hypothetical protein
MFFSDKLLRLSFDMMVRRNTEQSAQIDRLNTTVERLEQVIRGLTRQILLSRQEANPHPQDQQQNNNNNNNNNGQQQQQAQQQEQQQQPNGDEDDDDEPPPPPDDEDEVNDLGAPPPPPPPRGPQPPRRRRRRNNRRNQGNQAQVPLQPPEPPEPPLPPPPPVADMLRNDFVPDIPKALPKNMVELQQEYERKNLGQYTGNQRHWEKKYRTMWGKWHYLYHRLVLTARYANFRPNVPMDQWTFRMSLAALDFESRRKALKKSVAAFGVFLHKDDPAIQRRNRGPVLHI